MKTTTIRFNTPRNFRFNPKKHSTKTSEVIHTVPDETFTIEEILQRFTNGIDPYLTKSAMGHDSIDQDDFDDIPVNFKPDLTDLSEAEAFINETNDRIKEFKEFQARENRQENSNTIEKGVTDEPGK